MEAWNYWAFYLIRSQQSRLSNAASNEREAGMAVARLDDPSRTCPPRDLLRPIIRREATSTSALERTYPPSTGTEADFLQDSQMSFEQREIRNYVDAAEEATHHITEKRISRSFLGALQKTIVRGTKGDTADAGDIRPHHVAIGPKDRPIQEARFVPCPAGDQLEAGVADWEDWVADTKLSIVAKMAIAHYQFETLHPFGDGNGRLGRLVALLQVMQTSELRWAA